MCRSHLKPRSSLLSFSVVSSMCGIQDRECKIAFCFDYGFKVIVLPFA